MVKISRISSWILVRITEKIFDSVLNWFKGEKLQKDIDVPFISTNPNIGKYVSDCKVINGYDDLFNRSEVFFTGFYVLYHNSVDEIKQLL